MTITASGYYGLTMEKQLIDTSGQSMESETAVKGLLTTDTYAPNFDTHDFRNDVTDEVTGTGYSSGGQTITGTEITLSGGVLTWDFADPAWTSSTISSAMCLVTYFNVGSSSTDQLLLLLDFVSAVTTSAGTLTVQINASGAMTIDYTP